MSENKTGKYFKYAIGEIVLVAIGILLALSINNWNEKNKNNKEASFQLSKLKDNLNADKVNLKTSISQDSLYISNLVFCVQVLSNEVEASKEDFFNSFQFMSTTVNFEPTRGTFDGLISSGKIELINNQDLLDTLFSYYNESSYEAWDSALKDYSRNVIMPHLLEFDHIPNVTDINEGEGYTQFDATKFTISRKTIADYKNSLFVLNGLRQKIQLFEGQKIAYSELIKQIDTLIMNIETELQ